MNKNVALKILNLDKNYTIKELKKKYYKQALKYHPDKNKDSDAEEKFKQCVDAYTFLQKEKNINEEINIDYFSIIENFILNYLPTKVDEYLNSNFSLNLFNNLSQKASSQNACFSEPPAGPQLKISFQRLADSHSANRPQKRLK